MTRKRNRRKGRQNNKTRTKTLRVMRIDGMDILIKGKSNEVYPLRAEMQRNIKKDLHRKKIPRRVMKEITWR